MRIYFSGIGGVGIGPLAEIALDAGYDILGSDLHSSPLTEQLAARGVAIDFSQDGTALEKAHTDLPIDWFVYTSALPSDHSELLFAQKHGIRTSKRDELLAQIIDEKELKLIAVAGTHGKTTTTSMLIWVFHELRIPLSYSVGTNLGFAPSGHYDQAGDYFVYECDEYDRNFLHFEPYLSLIPALDYDHPETYENEHVYKKAFLQFIEQSNYTLMWEKDRRYLAVPDIAANYEAYDEYMDLSCFTLPGIHVKHNAFLVQKTLERLFPDILPEVITRTLNSYPGSGRRFEKLVDNLYTDYGHHPVEIAATLQMARELSDHVVLVYQPHQNIRQHELRHQYTACMEDAETIYWLPTYLTRENPDLSILSPEELISALTNATAAHAAHMDDALWQEINRHRDAGHLVLVMGAGTIDDWVRKKLIEQPAT